MRAETLSRGLGEERNSRERPAGIPAGPADPPAANEAGGAGTSATDVGAALPDFTDVMHGVARMLRDVEAMRYVVLSLVPEPDKVLRSAAHPEAVPDERTPGAPSPWAALPRGGDAMISMRTASRCAAPWAAIALLGAVVACAAWVRRRLRLQR